MVYSLYILLYSNFFFQIFKRFDSDNEDGTKSDDKLDKALLTALLEEIRDLREQLTRSIDVNTSLKEKLEKELGRPVSISPLVGTTTTTTTPFKDPTLSAKRSLFAAVLHSFSIAEDGDGGANDSRMMLLDQNKGSSSRTTVHFSPFETPTRDYGKRTIQGVLCLVL